MLKLETLFAVCVSGVGALYGFLLSSVILHKGAYRHIGIAFKKTTQIVFVGDTQHFCNLTKQEAFVGEQEFFRLFNFDAVDIVHQALSGVGLEKTTQIVGADLNVAGDVADFNSLG